MSLSADLAGVKVGDAHPVRIVGAINVSQESLARANRSERIAR